MIKNIVFDMGGVLAKINPERAIRSFEAIGVTDAADLINPYNHSGLFGDLERGTIGTDEFIRRLSAHCGRVLDPEDVRRAWLSIANPAEVDKLDYILRLRPRYRLYVLSNNNPIVTGWARTADFSAAGRPVTEDFEKPKIVWKRVGSILRFSYDDTGSLALDSTCFATGSNLAFLCCILNSDMGLYMLKDAPCTGTGDLLISVQAVEPLRIPITNNPRFEFLLEAQRKGYSESVQEEINREIFRLFDLNEEEQLYISDFITRFR